MTCRCPCIFLGQSIVRLGAAMLETICIQIVSLYGRSSFYLRISDNQYLSKIWEEVLLAPWNKIWVGFFNIHLMIDCKYVWSMTCTRLDSQKESNKILQLFPARSFFFFFFPVYIIDMPRYDQISLYKIMFRKKKDNLVICDLIYIIRISY